MVWYIGRNIPVRIKHLQRRLEQTEHWPKDKALKPTDVIELFKKKITAVDFSTAQREVLPFLKDPDSVKVWSQEFFKDIIARMQFI